MIKERKRVRLENYNYSKAGFYFLTLCIKDKEKILCEIVGDGALDVPKVILSKEGKIVEKYILTTNKIEGVLVEKYVIMPNHIHLLIKIEKEEGTSRAPSPTNEKIPHLVSSFKRFVNKEAGKNLFQRSYIDHIIRNEEDYINHLKYIDDNIFKWQEDLYFI